MPGKVIKGEEWKGPGSRFKGSRCDSSPHPSPDGGLLVLNILKLFFSSSFLSSALVTGCGEMQGVVRMTDGRIKQVFSQRGSQLHTVGR